MARRFPFHAVAGAVCALSLAWAPASAQTYQRSDTILNFLAIQKSGGAARSMVPASARGINIAGELPPQIDLPRIALTVNFDLNSANLTADGMIALRSLAKALHDPALQGMRFQIAGHTDALGDAVYNKTLSERRARTVVDHLVNQYQVPSDVLIPMGYGFTQPMDPSNPKNPLNRRVEVINLGPTS